MEKLSKLSGNPTYLRIKGNQQRNPYWGRSETIMGASLVEEGIVRTCE